MTDIIQIASILTNSNIKTYFRLNTHCAQQVVRLLQIQYYFFEWSLIIIFISESL